MRLCLLYRYACCHTEDSYVCMCMCVHVCARERENVRFVSCALVFFSVCIDVITPRCVCIFGEVSVEGLLVFLLICVFIICARI